MILYCGVVYVSIAINVPVVLSLSFFFMYVLPYLCARFLPRLFNR